MKRRNWNSFLAEGALLAAMILSACSFGTSSQASTTRQTAPGASPQGQMGAASQMTPIDWKAVDQAMGKPGAMQPGDVYKFSFPRSDLHVTVRGVPVKPGFALGSHIEFTQTGTNQAMYMGDLVLTEDEVNPVLAKLQQEGVELMALHNHLLGDTPKVMYLHIGGSGDPVKAAQAIHDGLAQSKTPLTAPGGSTQPQEVGFDTGQLDQILGYKGKASGGIYQYSVSRTEKITDHGMTLPPAIGVATAINFQATGGGKAATTGDFVLLGSEVQGVSEALKEHGIDVTALHSHSLTEAPRLFYLHFWGNDDPVTLGRGLRAALDKTNSQKAAS